MDSIEHTTPLIGLRGRQRIADFSVAYPRSIADAVQLRGEHSAVWMAGGIDLVDDLKQGRSVERVVPLSRLQDLKEIALTPDGTLRIGALVTYRELSEHPLVLDKAPDLAKLIGAVANIRIRSKATVGGSIMSRNGAYDLMPALLALGATLIFHGEDGDGASTARVAASQLTDDEQRLLQAVEIPASASQLKVDRTLRPSACAFLGFATKGSNGALLRLATSCTHPRPAVAEVTVDAASASDLAANAALWAEQLVASLPMPMSDTIASADYRRRVLIVLAKRLIAACATSSSADTRS